MTASSGADLHVHLTISDVSTAQVAGMTVARALAGAHPADFALALAEQIELVRHAIMAAGYFEVAAWDEWERIVRAGGDEA